MKILRVFVTLNKAEKNGKKPTYGVFRSRFPKKKNKEEKSVFENHRNQRCKRTGSQRVGFLKTQKTRKRAYHFSNFVGPLPIWTMYPSTLLFCIKRDTTKDQISSEKSAYLDFTVIVPSRCLLKCRCLYLCAILLFLQEIDLKSEQLIIIRLIKVLYSVSGNN